MQSSLYAKFLGKALPLDQAKMLFLTPGEVLEPLLWLISPIGSIIFDAKLWKCKTIF